MLRIGEKNEGVLTPKLINYLYGGGADERIDV